jgi:hypothetical protein
MTAAIERGIFSMRGFLAKAGTKAKQEMEGWPAAAERQFNGLIKRRC